MQDGETRKAIRLHALRRYGTVEKIWQDDDSWNIHIHRAICSFVNWASAHIRGLAHCRILNIGSAGEDYGVLPQNQTHLDIVDRLIKTKPRYVVADAEHLPFQDGTFQVALCVGSVLNYCSALEVITEIDRVLSAGGALILDFESSTSLEYVGRAEYNKDVAIVNTFFQDSPERIWVYSLKYILRLLKDKGFCIDRIKRVHILSALLLRLGFDGRRAARWGTIDPCASLVPWINKHGSNVILLCRKTSPECR